jgi:hypothetical protein
MVGPLVSIAAAAIVPGSDLTARDGSCPVPAHIRILKRLSTIMLLISVAAWPCLAGSQQHGTKITKRSRRAWLKLLKVPYDDCNLTYREETLPPAEQDLQGFKFHRLGKNEYLIEVLCAMGAYQDFLVFAYYNETNRKAPVCRLLRLKTYSQSGEAEVDTTRDPARICDATFNPEKKELELFNKASESGDCGTLVVYGFKHGIPFVKQVHARPCSEKGGAPTDPHTWQEFTTRRNKRRTTAKKAPVTGVRRELY